MMKKRLTAILFILGLVLLASCGKTEEAVPELLEPVRGKPDTGVVTRQDFMVTDVYTGAMTPKVTQVYMEGSGTVENFTVWNGKKVKKGDVLTVAQVAGIMSTRKTADLIPMCHPLGLSYATVTFEVDEEACTITAICDATTEGKTGVEMEALTGVSVALLTIYDMCKSVDRRMVMSDIHLVEKTGGKSGDFVF